MNKKELEFMKACERGTRPVGIRVIKSKAVQSENGGWVSRLIIGHHETQEDAEGFLETVRIMLSNGSGCATDYFSWGFAYAGDDIANNSYFKIAPLDYYERYRSFDGDPSKYFHLPPTLGFMHESGTLYRYAGDEVEGRQILIRVGLKELDNV